MIKEAANNTFRNSIDSSFIYLQRAGRPDICAIRAVNLRFKQTLIYKLRKSNLIWLP
jgi:hypothetical protein